MAKKSKGWSISPSKMVKDEVEQALTRKVRVLAFTALDQLILRSPVKSGRYRGNHKVSIGVPDYSYDNSTDIPMMPDLPNNPYITIFISNSLPYAEVIENGRENRAPENVYSSTFRDIQNL